MATRMPVEFPVSWRNPESPGYGTYPGPYNYQGLERYAEAVIKALALGYRHIDTAQAYENEAYIHQAMLASAVSREDIFLTSKLDPSRNSYQGALDGIAESKQTLGTIPDMYLIHYPGNGSAIEAWRGLIDAKANGLCRRIGVSNFEKSHLMTLLERTSRAPALNQIEFHPHLWSKRLSDLVDYCQQNDILVEGYSPLAEVKTGLLEEPVVLEIAQNHGSTPARILLMWCMQHGVRPIIGSLSETHMSENLGPYGFALTQQEMIQINALGSSQIRLSLYWGWDPTTAVLS
jgi:diketogulonate reductase-like aldo/keto reductase